MSGLGLLVQIRMHITVSFLVCYVCPTLNFIARVKQVKVSSPVSNLEIVLLTFFINNFFYFSFDIVIAMRDWLITLLISVVLGTARRLLTFKSLSPYSEERCPSFQLSSCCYSLYCPRSSVRHSRVNLHFAGCRQEVVNYHFYRRGSLGRHCFA